MNLARVEYYLADCLSAMESGNDLLLDTRGDPAVRDRVAWSPNIFLFGTINIDETTLRISDKVLDRAQVIDTSNIDLTGSLDRWLGEAAALNAADRARIKEIITGTWTILREADAHFGFRTAHAIVAFINEAKASSGGVLTVDAALDAQLRQKVLTKLRGEGEQWSVLLGKLEGVMAGLGPTGGSAAVIGRMRRDLERIGSFQFWN
jgi:5-methylcytosine-specific restriction protein B